MEGEERLARDCMIQAEVMGLGCPQADVGPLEEARLGLALMNPIGEVDWHPGRAYVMVERHLVELGELPPAASPQVPVTRGSLSLASGTSPKRVCLSHAMLVTLLSVYHPNSGPVS